MIVVASQRGGAGQLAAHLMNDRDNDHVMIEELRGFVADDLYGAFQEAHAIAKGTRCTQFLFSVSFNPPKDAAVHIDLLVDAANRAEEVLGLTDQPRAIVIHEKHGRRHAHVVWSRISATEMKAINMSHFKNRLNVLSRDLYLENGWELPEGHRTNGWKNPLNFSLAEWQQAKRIDLDPREIKQVFREAWQQSDNLRSFRSALEERGYFLAQGDRRAFVALDLQGEVYAVARWAGLKTKEVKDRLGSPEALPGVEAVRQDICTRMTDRLRDMIREDREKQRAESQHGINRRDRMVAEHRAERDRLRQRQEDRWRVEANTRAVRLHTGIRGVWDVLTGRAAAVRRQNEQEAYQAYRRDREQREHLFAQQIRERQALQSDLDAVSKRHRCDRLLTIRRIARISGTAVSRYGLGPPS